MRRFQDGDTVMVVGRKKPQTVCAYDSYGRYSVKNADGTGGYKYAYEHQLSPYEEPEPKNKMATLYKLTDDSGNEVFGTHIGTNASNQYVIEVKGGGGILVRSPKDIEEVIPYTFSIKCDGKEVHYIGQEGVLGKGDLVVLDCNGIPKICLVTGVDTKSKSARANFKGRKLVTEKV